MGKQFKASTKLTAKFLVVLMVLQAVLFSLSAFAETAPTSVTIKKGITDVSGTTLVAFIGTPIALTATPNSTVTSTAYKKYFWHSSNLTAIPVSTGDVAAKTFNPAAKGTGVVVSVYNAVDNTGPTSTVTFNVYRKLTGFTIPDAGKLTVKVGRSGTIKETVLIPSDADVTETVYSLSATEAAKGVIKINTTDGINTVAGAVYGVKSGTSTVIVTKKLPDGTTIAKTFLVTVPEPVNSLLITTNGKDDAGATLGIIAGKKTTLKAKLTSLTAGTKVPTDTKVVWSRVSGSTGIAIDANTGIISLTDLTDGAIGLSAVISATANDTWNSAADTITVTVGKELSSLSVTNSTYVLKVGDDKQIIPVFKSSNATAPTITSVTYTAETGKTGVLTVGLTTGIIHGVGAGTAKITVKATAADGTSKSTIVTATVVADVTNIVLTAPITASSTKPMKLYSKVTIKATVTGGSAKLNTVRFKSNDTSIAFVNIYTGEVTAVGVGNTTISASAVTSGATVTSTTSVPVFVTDPDGLLTP